MPLLNQVKLTRKATLLAKVESVSGTDALPGAADAIAIMDPEPSVDVTFLERNVARDDISPTEGRAGRKLSKFKFKVDARSNGRTHSGNISDAPILGRLLRACAFSEAAVTGAGTIGRVRPFGTVTGPAVTFATGGANSKKDYYDYLVTVVLGGASATAKLRVTEENGYEPSLPIDEDFDAVVQSAAGTVVVNAANPLSVTYTVGGTWAVGETVVVTVNGSQVEIDVTTATTTAVATQIAAAINTLSAQGISAAAATSVVTVTYTGAANGVAVTSGTTAVALGTSGATLTPTWAGNLVIGQKWRVRVAPTGIKYLPVSDLMETITLYLYLDGVLHKMTTGQGTVSFNAEAGNYGSFEFEFTGSYVEPVDAKVPAGITDTDPLPPVFENAKLRLDGEDVVIANFSFEMANTVSIRPDANSPDGYRGTRITARTPTGGLDPEMRSVADYNFYRRLAKSDGMLFSARIGADNGNVIWVKAPKIQYTGVTYGDRDGIRVYDAAVKFSRELGNDELEIFVA